VTSTLATGTTNTGKTTPAPDTDPDTGPPASPVTEALIICCTLAWQGNPLGGLDTGSPIIESIVRSTRTRHTTAQILNWRSATEPDTWSLRWRWARRITRRHYGHALGINALPLDERHLAVLDPTPANP
jgi:hypothetical protein